MVSNFHRQLLIVIPALLPTYLLRFTLFGIPTNLLEILIITAAIAGALTPSIRQAWRQLMYRLPRSFVACTLLFILSAILSTIISPHLLTSLGILKGWIFIPMLCAAMIAAWTDSSGASASWQRQGVIVTSLLLGGLAIALYSFSALGQGDRLTAFYDTPNSLALFLAPLTTLAFFSGATWQSRRFYFLTAVILFLALLATQSVGGILAVIVALSVGFIISKKQTSRLRFDIWSASWRMKIGALVAALAVIATWTLLPRVNYLLQPNSSAHVRLQLWSISLDLIKQNPLLGIGLGTFEPAYQHQLHQRFQELSNCHPPTGGVDGTCAATQPLPEFVFRDPHSWPLSFYLNLGLLGLVSFIALNYLALKPLLKRPYKLSAISYQLPIALALLAMLLHGLVDTIYWKNDLALLWWLVISMLILSSCPSSHTAALDQK